MRLKRIQKRFSLSQLVCVNGAKEWGYGWYLSSERNDLKLSGNTAMEKGGGIYAVGNQVL